MNFADPLVLESPDSNDYILPEDGASVWITVKNVSLWIVPGLDGVKVAAFRKEDEMDNPLNEMFTAYPEEEDQP